MSLLLNGMLLGTRIGKKVTYSQKILDLFGSSIILWYKMNENIGATAVVDSSTRLSNGVATNVLFGEAGFGDGFTSAWIYNTGSYINIQTSGLPTDFNGDEGSFLMWYKPSSVGVWSDVVTADYLMRQRVDATNEIAIFRPNVANTFEFLRRGGGLKEIILSSQSWIGWNHVASTWSSSNGRFRGFLGGVKVGEETGIGSFVGTSTSSLIGASVVGGTNGLYGWLDQVIYLNREATPAEILKAATL